MIRTLAVLMLLLSLPPIPSASAADKLTVILDWFINPDHAPILIAQELGYFAAQDLAVEIVAPADPNDAPKLVAAGQADIGVGYQPQLHLQVDQGLPLVRVGTLVATPLNILMVLADSGINSVADFKGKRIGISVGGFEDAVLRAMLGKHGLGLGDIQQINVNFALTPALLAGQVDGVIGAYRNFELNQLALENRPGRAFFPEEEGVPSYDELIFIANKSALGEPKLRRFIDAVEAGARYLVNHPKDSFALFIKGRPELDDALNRRAWDDTWPRFSQSPAALDTARYDRFARFLKAQDLIKTVPPVADYAVELAH